MNKNKLGTIKHYIFNTTLRVIVTDTYSKAATDTLAQAQSRFVYTASVTSNIFFLIWGHVTNWLFLRLISECNPFFKKLV